MNRLKKILILLSIVGLGFIKFKPTTTPTTPSGTILSVWGRGENGRMLIQKTNGDLYLATDFDGDDILSVKNIGIKAKTASMGIDGSIAFVNHLGDLYTCSPNDTDNMLSSSLVGAFGKNQSAIQTTTVLSVLDGTETKYLGYQSGGVLALEDNAEDATNFVINRKRNVVWIQEESNASFMHLVADTNFKVNLTPATGTVQTSSNDVDLTAAAADGQFVLHDVTISRDQQDNYNGFVLRDRLNDFYVGTNFAKTTDKSTALVFQFFDSGAGFTGYTTDISNAGTHTTTADQGGPIDLSINKVKLIMLAATAGKYAKDSMLTPTSDSTSAAVSDSTSDSSTVSVSDSIIAAHTQTPILTSVAEVPSCLGSASRAQTVAASIKTIVNDMITDQSYTDNDLLGALLKETFLAMTTTFPDNIEIQNDIDSVLVLFPITDLTRLFLANVDALADQQYNELNKFEAQLTLIAASAKIYVQDSDFDYIKDTPAPTGKVVSYNKNIYQLSDTIAAQTNIIIPTTVLTDPNQALLVAQELQDLTESTEGQNTVYSGKIGIANTISETLQALLESVSDAAIREQISEIKRELRSRLPRITGNFNDTTNEIIIDQWDYLDSSNAEQFVTDIESLLIRRLEGLGSLNAQELLDRINLIRTNLNDPNNPKKIILEEEGLLNRAKTAINNLFKPMTVTEALDIAEYYSEIVGLNDEQKNSFEYTIKGLMGSKIIHLSKENMIFVYDIIDSYVTDNQDIIDLKTELNNMISNSNFKSGFLEQARDLLTIDSHINPENNLWNEDSPDLWSENSPTIPANSFSMDQINPETHYTLAKFWQDFTESWRTWTPDLKADANKIPMLKICDQVIASVNANFKIGKYDHIKTAAEELKTQIKSGTITYESE